MADAPLVTQLAEELVWKIEHPQQHSSRIDEVLGDYLRQVGDDVPAELAESIRKWVDPDAPPRGVSTDAGSLFGDAEGVLPIP
jgi:hypothetical protein